MVIDYFRKNKAQKEHEYYADEKLNRLGDQGRSVEDQVLDRETHEQVLVCMKQLPENDRTVLHLRFVQGFSIDDTAQVMSKTSAAIKSIQTRARKKLLDLIRNEVSVHD